MRKVTDVTCMFRSSLDLKDLNLWKLDINSITKMDSIFQETNLISIDLSNQNTTGMKSMSNLFYHSTALKTINFGIYFDTSQVTSMSGMFGYCQSLESLDLSTFDTCEVLDMSSMFGWCTNLKNINISSFNMHKVIKMNFMFGYTGLEALDVSYLNISNVKDMSQLFYNSDKLRSINFGNFDTSGVTNMDEMFYNCKSLEYLNLTSFNITKVETMKYLFYGCNNLEYINISSLYNKKINSLEYLFYNCKNLKSLDLSGLNIYIYNKYVIYIFWLLSIRIFKYIRF